MIAEIGLASLWIAAALAVLQLVMGFASLKPGQEFLAGIVRPVAVVQGLLALISFGCLIWVFYVTDLSVLLVADNSHSMKPMLFKIAGAWGNHEGSMLLWVSILAAAGAAIALFERRLPNRVLVATLASQAILSLGFYAFILLSSNPFTRISPVPPEGMGLNPLLQDAGLAFHPPTLYIGYVGLSVAFSFAVGALVTRSVGPAFARAMRPWVLMAWIFLTLGITAGSYWAYYELGWGGWWFWDPVENASLMPWLAATALLHSVSVTATRDALRAWTVMLAVVAFSMSMIGTFIVRSGLLTSVHAFAVDPTRGVFILGLLIFYIGGALALYGARVGTVTEGEKFELFSREGALVINNLLLSVILGVVLIGTLWPIVAEAAGDKISIGPPYFNKAAGPIALLLVAVMAVGPLLKWRRDNPAIVMSRMVVPVMATIAVLVVVLIMGTGIGVMPLLGLALAGGVAVASFLPLRGRKLLRTPLTIWGMVIAHLGIAVSLAGMASDSAFTKEKLVAAEVGDYMDVGPWRVMFVDVRPVAGPNWTAVEAELIARRHGGPRNIMRPQSRNFVQPETVTNEAALLTAWNGQLYAVMGEQGEDGRWQMRLWWKPFVTLIWLGGMMIALGGVLAWLGRVDLFRRIRKFFARRAQARWERP